MFVRLCFHGRIASRIAGNDATLSGSRDIFRFTRSLELVHEPGAFRLDHLQPVELILSQNFSNFLISILGLPFLITPDSQREEEKGFTQK